jgi:uncharacterized glyoxalase superfamily protein PhnB
LHSITPRIVVDDPARFVRFLQQVFSAAGDYRTDMPSILRIGDSNIMVSGAGAREPKPAFLYVYVDDADATYRRALNAGATPIEQPQQTPYGDRRAMITDPWGNDWQIATYSGLKP